MSREIAMVKLFSSSLSDVPFSPSGLQYCHSQNISTDNIILVILNFRTLKFVSAMLLIIVTLFIDNKFQPPRLYTLYH